MTRAWPVAWSATAFMAVAALGIALRPFLPIDETRYLAVAWEMHLSGDFFVPTKNGELYTHKPPMLFWLINLVWAFTGVNEFAARLVAPAFAGLTILLTARLASILWPDDPQTKRRAALVLASFSLFAGFGGATMFDTMLATGTLVGLIGLYRALSIGGYGFWAIYGLGIALGIFAKGPVIFFHLIPVLILFPFWLPRPEWPPLREVLAGFGVALLVAVAVVGLWLGPALIMGGPEYREAVLWTQSAGRMTKSFAHAREWWFYPVVLPAVLFPWFWVPAVWRGAVSTRIDPGMRFALAWALGTGLLFGIISAKQLHYLIPVMPAVALMIGRVLPDDFGRSRAIFAVIPILFLAVATLALDLGASGDAGIERFLSPSWAIWIWAALLIGLCAAVFYLPLYAGHFVLGLGLVLSLDILISISDPGETYDTHRIGSAMAERQEDGVAVNQGGYHAEFNFAGRLTRPVDIVLGETEVAAWATDHPRGIIVGQTAYTTIPWQQRETVIFRNKPYGLWYVEDSEPGAVGND